MAGYNYAVFDSNIDLHGLRREHIKRLQEPRQVVLFSGSRFQEAVPALFPGQSFYNANIHSDYIEGAMAITELLLRHQRLPDTFILSVQCAHGGESAVAARNAEKAALLYAALDASGGFYRGCAQVHIARI